MNNSSEKILITGATGLVGTRLVPRLLAAGFDCHALIRSSKRLPEGVSVLEGDLLDVDSLEHAVRGVSAIIHLAAVFRSPDKGLIWKANFDGTRNLIAAVKNYAPDARFIMASTAHVYNIDNPHPGREDDAVNPAHAYPASKVAAEQELILSGLKWAVLRFPFIYGDGDGHLEELPKHVIPAKWHPAMKMSTVHHRDIFSAVEMALKGIMDAKIVNISDDAPTSIYELLRLVGTEMDSSSVPLENPWYLHIDSALARELGFRPVVKTVYQAVIEQIM